MKIIRKGRNLLIILGALLLLGGCQSKMNVDKIDSAVDEKKDNNYKESTKTTEDNNTIIEDKYGFEIKANEVVVTDETVSFVDGVGSEKTIAKKNIRVVPLNASLSNIWYEAGGEIVGRVGGSSSTDKQLPAEYLAESIPVVANSLNGKEMNVEEIFDKSNPEMVLLATSMSQPTLASSFEALGVESIVVDYEGLSDYLKWLKIFANINNKPEIYENLGKEVLKKCVKVLDQVPTENNPSVLCMFAQPTSLVANLSGSTVGGMLKQMGCDNIADLWDNKDGLLRLDINLEAVLAADPDIIVVQCHAGDEQAKELIEKTYGDNPIWKELKAVKENKIYYLDTALFHYKAHSRYGEAYEILGEILYPSIYKNN